jgi:methyl-accepting chemotaxis protein
MNETSRSFPLHFKIAALVVVSLSTLTVGAGSANFLYLRSVLQREAIARGKGVADTLAQSMAEISDAALPATLAGIKRDANLSYLEVLSRGGVVLAHTFGKGSPIQDELVLKSTQGIRQTVIDGNSFIDIEVSSPPPPAKSDRTEATVIHVGLDPSAATSAAWAAQKLLALVMLVALVIAAVATYLLAARFVKPLRTLTEAAQRIVDGDLTHEIEINSRDETGELALAFSQMQEKLKEVLRALQESVQLLTNAGDELGQSTEEQSQTITRQATALQETQVTAQEIKQTSLLASQKAEAVLALTEKADAVSAQGEIALESSLAGLTDIRAQVDEIAQRIGQLVERTEQIGGITQTVKDLADQSNMLALNAAIEAVRSGEHGKGFAVVAREIRSLADQSIQATSRVREILEDIGSAIRGAVGITEHGSQKIDVGLTQVRSTGENLRALSNIVKDNSAAVRQIAAAVSQQNAGITQIFAAVTDQTRMMDETMRRLETTTKAAQVLKQLSQRVSDVVGRFKV